MQQLYFEPLTMLHAESLTPIWADEDVIRYVNIKAPCTLEEIKERIRVLSPFDVFVVRCEGQVIGIIGCPCIDQERARYGLFYHFGKSAWGQGFATRATQWLLDYMREKYLAPILYADVVAENVASEKILLRLGFQKISEEDVFEKNGVVHVVHNYCRTLN